ncbi:MAG TPA: thioredoxin [Armatimonadetes bacterium]|nr:thioredoxin [Armatimonadota bacterium]
MANVTDVTDAAFEEVVLKSDIPVLVDFWAPWCGPCRMLGPIIEKVADKVAGTVKVVKLNVDDNSATAGEYGILSIPTVMIFKDGQKVEQLVGLTDEATLLSKLDALK